MWSGRKSTASLDVAAMIGLMGNATQHLVIALRRAIWRMLEEYEFGTKNQRDSMIPDP